MSSPNRGGCGCLLVVIVIIALIALAVTKPNEAAHRNAIARRTPVLNAFFGAQKLLGVADLEYHDYLLFSVMTMTPGKGRIGIPVSYGFLGKVYYDKDK
jgi:hypothetical protein